jgi:hypothetical protein
MAATAPSLSSVQVPRAKIRQGAGPAASLMIVAQSPDRFAGTIQVSGNELVSLAVNEESYGLRWVGGREGAAALTPGYYSGPPSRCAVGTLLGIDLEPEALVELVLGGAPLIDEPYEVVGRSWDRKAGRERLRIANARYEQELAFAWIDGHWQFAGASLSTASGDWLWTISHEELHEVGGEILPAKTEIRRPKAKGRGEQVLKVSFLKQVPNPSFGGEQSSDPPPEDGGQPANAGDTWDEWDDDDWDEEDGGGEDEGEGDDGEEPESAPIPPQFVGNPTGLTPRGDLCR